MSKLPELRTRIDKVDRDLLALIRERLSLAAQVREAKQGTPDSRGIWRPSREESLVRDLIDESGGEGDVDPTLVSRIWAELVSASLRVQGPMQVHIGLEGDKLATMKLVRDRFGAALPTHTYPTSSTALAAAHADPEGVAILPSPGTVVHWWTALCPGGAMEEMKILTGLPRVRNRDWPKDDWPRAVAVAAVEPKPSGADRWICVTKGKTAERARSTAGDWTLFATWDEPPEDAHVIGILPDPLPPE